ncbi:MAG: polyamine aminopropyltransferase [Nitrospirota bacterium]
MVKNISIKDTKISNNWFIDKESEHRWIYHRMRRHLLSLETKFQQVRLIDTYNFGRVLVLDNKIQSAESDEYIYHEVLVHPAMITHPEPRDVLILGGGEGAVLREVLKHSTVKRAVMVDIDKELVEFCKEHLEKWHRGSFFDKRAEIVFDNAIDFVKNTRDRFDIVIADISDPIEKGPASLIYTKECYRSIMRILSDDGIFVTQATEVFYNQQEVHSIINKTVASVFPIAESYCDYIPSFTSMWGFVTGSQNYSLKKITPEEIEDGLRRRGVKGLRYYDLETHERLFNLPMRLRKMISSQKFVATIKKPIKVYSNR